MKLILKAIAYAIALCLALTLALIIGMAIGRAFTHYPTWVFFACLVAVFFVLVCIGFYKDLKNSPH